MRVVVCPDSFKGSLSSVEAANAIERGLRSAAGPETLEVVKMPLADGGEGTIEALVRAAGGDVRRVRVHDPLGREIESFYGVIEDGAAAVIEMAAASGLGLLSASERNPLITTTCGTGELLKAAADAGVKKIVIGIGGSATNDGGAGAMSALGGKFLDRGGAELPAGGAALLQLARIDMSGFRFPEIEVQVASDVDNPLCGPNGASAVFGPQKGATPEMVKRLDAALAHYARVVKNDLGRDIVDLPGAGAAGGLGAGLAAFLNARMSSGIDLVLDASHFDDAIAGADLIITGEGRIDEQTSHGKAIMGVLRRAAKVNVPVVALAGSIAGEIDSLYQAGLTAAFSICAGPMSVDEAIERAGDLLANASANLIRLKL